MAPIRASGFCRRAERGFTLVEVMVLLTLIAALLAIAAPQFTRLYLRTRVAFERQDVERQLGELPERVRLTGRAGVLGDPQSAAAPGFEHDWERQPGQPQRLALELPPDWEMTVPRPIFYHFTGACDGGEVIVALPPMSLRYVLTPPLCRPRVADDQ